MVILFFINLSEIGTHTHTHTHIYILYTYIIRLNNNHSSYTGSPNSCNVITFHKLLKTYVSNISSGCISTPSSLSSSPKFVIMHSGGVL